MTSQKNKTTKHSGYVYNNKTKEGFQRMRRLGIVTPPFRIEDNVTKLLTNHYDRLLSKLAQAAKGAIALERVVNDSVYSEIVGQLQNALFQAISADKKKLATQLSKQLSLSQKHFFDDFIEDANDKVSIRIQFALDKDEVFQQRIEGLHKYYLDTALERIKREEDFLKYAFLQEMTRYTMGESKDLSSLSNVISSMKKTSMSDARMFSRDQFSKFNSALTIASIEQSGATHMEWITVQDGRVRSTHKALNHKVFPKDQIPKEKWDYGCRCGLVPIFKD